MKRLINAVKDQWCLVNHNCEENTAAPIQVKLVAVYYNATLEFKNSIVQYNTTVQKYYTSTRIKYHNTITNELQYSISIVSIIQF